MRYVRGGKFTSREFDKFYEDIRIHVPLTIPRFPRQNGVDKQKN